jgi:DNA modification methylase
MADSFEDKQPQKKYKRHTYRHSLNRALTANNSGAMQWGAKYKELHMKAWLECYRVLKVGGVFILNISDHIRNGAVVPVTQWHVDEIIKIGFTQIEHIKAETKRQRHGQNGGLRLGHESVVVFNK